MKRVKLICDECRTPVAELVGNTVVIQVNHHGQKHTTIIPIEELLGKLEKVTVDNEKVACIELR